MKAKGTARRRPSMESAKQSQRAIAPESRWNDPLPRKFHRKKLQVCLWRVAKNTKDGIKEFTAKSRRTQRREFTKLIVAILFSMFIITVFMNFPLRALGVFAVRLRCSLDSRSYRLTIPKLRQNLPCFS